jgi:ABC-2 type transport system ATP-binding protein
VFLDELTQGLDPQSRRMTWDLIRDIRDGGTTVVLVTHFMDEAEHLCDRVGIVDQGRLVALDAPQALIDGLGMPARVRFSTDCADVGWLDAVGGVRRVERNGHAVVVEGVGPVLALTAAALVAHGLTPPDLRVERPTLEDAFLALTGRTVRG